MMTFFSFEFNTFLYNWNVLQICCILATWNGRQHRIYYYVERLQFWKELIFSESTLRSGWTLEI